MTSWMFFFSHVFGSWCGLGGPSRRSIQDGLQPALYGGAHVDVSIFAHVSWFLLNLARFFSPHVSWFLTNFAIFLVSSKSRPPNVVVTKWFSPDLSVCHFL
jgi:hypothetical protein